MTPPHPERPALEPIMLPVEIAPLLHVSLRTLRRLKAQRLIRIVRISPRVWGMRPSDISAYCSSREEGGDGVVPTIGRPKGTRIRVGNVVPFSAQVAL